MGRGGGGEDNAHGKLIILEDIDVVVHSVRSTQSTLHLSPQCLDTLTQSILVCMCVCLFPLPAYTRRRCNNKFSSFNNNNNEDNAKAAAEKKKRRKNQSSKTKGKSKKQTNKLSFVLFSPRKKTVQALFVSLSRDDNKQKRNSQNKLIKQIKKLTLQKRTWRGGEGEGREELNGRARECQRGQHSPRWPLCAFQLK